MIGKLWCMIGWHNWRDGGADPVPRYCARCGWGPVVETSPIADPEDPILFDRTFIRCAVLLNIYAPALAPEFRRLWTAPMNEVAEWLDRHFPLKEGRWGTRSPAGIYHDLKAQMDGEL